MRSRRLVAVALTACACFFAAPSMAAVPAPADLSSPSLHRLNLGPAGSVRSGEPVARISRAARADMLLTLAWSLRGVAYRYGGHSPGTGFDCSGLVRYVFRHALGELLPHRARLQFDAGKHVSRGQLEPGDLVFFRTGGHRISHVGIYIDHGRFLNAPRRGEVVQVDNLDNPYWSRHYAGARRLVGASEAG